jgi:hypothetical protein
MIIAILTAIAGIVWGLYRLQNSGVDLNAFNPFFWLRRKKWQNQLNTKPIYLIENPIETAALLIVAIAKMDGEITREQKNLIIQLFKDEFSTTTKAATELYTSASYSLKDVINITDEIRLILAPSKDAFKPNHIKALLDMLLKVASTESLPNNSQCALIAEIQKQLIANEEILKWN